MKQTSLMIILLTLFSCKKTDSSWNISQVHIPQDQLDNRLQLIDSIMTAYQTEYQFSGSVLIGLNGKIIYQNESGFANYQLRTKNSFVSRYRIASLTKQFTAAALLILAQENRIGLNQPIHHYLSGLNEKLGQVTIHQLLSHSSGLSRDIESIADEIDGKHFVELKVLIDKINQSDLIFEPGERYAYSNLGFTLAAAIIESVTKLNYGAALKQLIFDPIGMSNTGHEESRQPVEQLSTGHVDLVTKTIPARTEDKSYVIGAGSIYSTVEDLFKWSSALLSGQIISSENRKKIMTRQAGRYSYGWFVNSYVWPPVSDTNTAVNIHHSGGSPGFESKISLLTNHKAVIIILSNKIPSSLNSISNQLTNSLVGFDESLPFPDTKRLVIQSLFEKGIDSALSQIENWKTSRQTYLIPKRNDLLLIGRGYLDSRQFEKADLIFDLLIQSEEKWVYSYLFKGIMKEEIGKLEEAKQLYRQILDIDPNQSNAINRLKKLE